jgi:diguanylate cyclase (GGDEF)-like protein
MQSAQLRKELAGVEATTVRVVETGRGAPLPLASVAFHDARGRRTASLHGVVRRDELATRLLGDLVGRGGNILVVVDDGRIVAAARPRDKDASGSLSPELFENPDAGLRMVFSATRGPNLTSTRPAGLYGWTLVAEQPLHEALRPLLLAALGYALAGVALVLFCTLAASRAALRWVRPLWDLLRGIRDASKGHGVDPISTAGTQAETEALIEAFNVMLGRLGSKRREIETSHRALQEQHEAFRHQYETVSKLSITDALTQVPNRRYFETQLQCEVKRLTRTGQKLVLLILDIDDFKKLNDRYGHAAGDEFLQQVARILKEMVRETDLLARFGGEEFVVVATGTTLEGAVVLAEKIRTAVAEASFIVDETMRPRKATVSIGVAEFKGSQTDLFNSADAALYRAKAAGKNCVMVAGEQDPEA